MGTVALDWLALPIFALTWLLIATRSLRPLPIGRAAGALLGAAAMVAAGILRPEQAYLAVEHDTVLLLFAMMWMTAYLEEDGSFDWIGRGMARFGGTPWRLLVSVSIGSALLSAFLVNDTVCVFFTPLIVAICRRHGLPMGPYLIALATSANVGSAATLVGNPQNMIIGAMSQMPFGEFAARTAPAVLAALLVQIGLLAIYYRRRLPAYFAHEALRADPLPNPPPPARGKEFRDPVSRGVPRGLAGAAMLGVALCFFLGLHMGFSALAGVLLVVLVQRRDPAHFLARVDWSLLVFFCGLFIVVEGLNSAGLVQPVVDASREWLGLDRWIGIAAFSGLVAAGSNVVSNVPMVLLAGPLAESLGRPELSWSLLAFVSTVAGNLTLVGSVANLIVAERARPDYELGFVEYLRYGVVATLASLAAGVPVLVAIASAFPA